MEKMAYLFWGRVGSIYPTTPHCVIYQASSSQDVPWQLPEPLGIRHTVIYKYFISLLLRRTVQHRGEPQQRRHGCFLRDPTIWEVAAI